LIEAFLGLSRRSVASIHEYSERNFMIRQGTQRVNILGVGVGAVNMQQALAEIASWIDQRNKTYVVVCPVHTVMLCQRDSNLRHLVNRAGLVTPDGMPLVFLSRWKGHKHVGRVYGPDLLLALSELAAKRGYCQYYYGGADGVPEQLAEKLSSQFPNLRVVGSYSPPFREMTPEEDRAIIDAINTAEPDVIWVGLGSPKQDLWMAQHREQLNAPVLIGVGAAFDFLTHRVPQAPKWMQKSALEWLYRLGTEPQRLWRRYLIDNPLFVLNVILQSTGLKHWSLD
jgi:N-acetylglucosaminyldiphosphoundecaprenol N-acetyl-beta-D-mannosaminyltransferase